MYTIGRKVYYGKSNGLVIWDKGEMGGSARENTFEEDCAVVPILTLIPADELGVKQFEIGEYAEEFSLCKGFKINPETEQPEFVY